MANKVTMELKGLKELEQALRELPAEVKRGPIIYRALHDGARPIAKEAKARAPVLQDRRRAPHRQPGAIRAGITQHASRHEKYVVVVRVRSRGYIFDTRPDTRRTAKSPSRAGNANYWWLVHFGTSRQAPIPFLYGAFEAKKVEAARAIQLSLLRGVAVVAKKLGFDVRNWAA